MNKEERKIRIFQTFADQEAWHKEQMKNSSITERFRCLLQMQQLTKALHSQKTEKRKIIIHHGYIGQ
jgi:hypothetical protein